MVDALVKYRWTCPICSETKHGLSARDAMTAREHVKHAFLIHVRTRADGRHGGRGEYPSGFEPERALEHAEFGERVGEGFRSIPP